MFYFSVLIRRNAEQFLEGGVELHRIGISDTISDFGYGHICIDQQFFCMIEFVFDEILVRRNSEMFLKYQVQLYARIAEFNAQVVYVTG